MRIAIFSLIPWGFFKQRPHAFAKELAARGHKVYFFEPIAFDLPLKDFLLKLSGAVKCREVEKNIYLVTSLLFQGRENVRWLLWCNAVTGLLMKFFLKWLRLDFIIAIEHEYAPILRSLGVPYAYDHIDDTEFFPGLITSRVLANTVSLKEGSVFNTYIQKEEAEKDSKGLFITNGCDPDVFFPTNVKEKFFDAVVIACFSAWVDFETIMASEKKILLIGPIENKEWQRRLIESEKKNISWIPAMDKSAANLWLNRARVGLVPFREDHPVTAYAVPVKILEYFLCDMPVVTYRNKGIEDSFGSKVTFYSSTGEGLSLDEAIEAADTQGKKGGYRRFAEGFNWATVIGDLEAKILEHRRT